MVRIIANASANEKKLSFSIKGHARYAAAGSDIVCSAISILGYTTISALQDLTNLDVIYQISDDKAEMSCEVLLPENDSYPDYIKANTIFDTFVIGCCGVEEAYGNKYIKFEKKVIN